MILRTILHLMIICFSLSFSISLHGKENSIILDIRKEYNRIESNLKGFVKKDLEMQEGDPSTLTGYFNGKKLVRIYYQTGDNMGNSEEYYYFRGDKLFFIYIVSICNMQVPDNRCKKAETRDRYYFHNSRLIMWLDTGKQKVSRDAPLFKTRGEELVKRAMKFKRKFVKPQ